MDARAAYLLVQPEAMRLVRSVHDVLQVFPHELEELLEHLLNLGLLERPHDAPGSHAPRRASSRAWAADWVARKTTTRPRSRDLVGERAGYARSRVRRTEAAAVRKCRRRSNVRPIPAICGRFDIKNEVKHSSEAFAPSFLAGVRRRRWRPRESPVGASPPVPGQTCWASRRPTATRMPPCTWATSTCRCVRRAATNPHRNPKSERTIVGGSADPSSRAPPDEPRSCARLRPFQARFGDARSPADPRRFRVFPLSLHSRTRSPRRCCGRSSCRLGRWRTCTSPRTA